MSSCGRCSTMGEGDCSTCMYTTDRTPTLLRLLDCVHAGCSVKHPIHCGCENLKKVLPGHQLEILQCGRSTAELNEPNVYGKFVGSTPTQHNPSRATQIPSLIDISRCLSGTTPNPSQALPKRWTTATKSWRRHKSLSQRVVSMTQPTSCHSKPFRVFSFVCLCALFNTGAFRQTSDVLACFAHFVRSGGVDSIPKPVVIGSKLCV